MNLLRTDGWKQEDDEVLATIVLTHIRSKSTQLAAFEDAAERLGRTTAACGFRWNSVVRNIYKTEIEKAKKQRTAFIKENHVRRNTFGVTPHTHPLDTIMEQISSYKKTFENMEKQIKELKSENVRKDKIIESLNRKLDETMSPKDKMTDDYVSLMQILNRARELGALDRVN